MKLIRGLACILGAMVVCLASSAAAEQQWVEVQSPHFRVITDGTTGDARKVASEFEQIRHVFVLRFNTEQLRSGPPLTIFAVRNAGGMMDIAPAAWKANGERISGFNTQRWESQFALVRLDTWGDNNQVVAYYNYANSVLHANSRWTPIWLDVGWSEFYSFTQCQQNQTLIGTPSSRTRDLHARTLIPVADLFAVRRGSPFLTNEQQNDLFRAETWALMHYMIFGEGKGNGAKMGVFLQQLRDGVPEDKAFATNFGDVATFQRSFFQYASQGAFKAGVLPPDQHLDPKSFTERRLSAAEADYEIGRFQIGIRDGKDGRVSVEKALAEDSNLAAAHEEMAYLHYDEGRDEQAKEEFQKAVLLNPGLARSHFALIMLGKPIAQQSSAELRATQLGLQKVTELDPNFAPTYVELALVEARLGTTQQAYKDALKAEALEPSRAGYRILTGHILLMGHQPIAAAEIAKFVGSRWYGSDAAEAVDLWQRIPASQRGDGPALQMNLAPGVVMAEGQIVQYACNPDGKKSLTFQAQEAAGTKTLTFTHDGHLASGFADTLWYGADHFNTCAHATGQPGMILYKPQSDSSGQLLQMEVRDSLPAIPQDTMGAATTVTVSKP
ncbi:MAG: tetratricopeptide repeat protein [Janthinobacterium lividum]